LTIRADSVYKRFHDAFRIAPTFTTGAQAGFMTPDRLKNRRLAGVFLLGWVLFNYPVLSLFNRHTTLLGIPLLYAYVFGAWALVILLIMLGVRFSRRPPGQGR
jgi:hypothetical protein